MLQGLADASVLEERLADLLVCDDERSVEVAIPSP